jgi:hypothetical protein
VPINFRDKIVRWRHDFKIHSAGCLIEPGPLQENKISALKEAVFVPGIFTTGGGAFFVCLLPARRADTYIQEVKNAGR